MGSFKSGFKQIISFKANMIRFKVMMNDLITNMLSTFTELGSSKNIKEILDVLVKQPDTTLTNIKNNVVQNGEFNMKDLTTTETTVKQGKLGLLDVFEKVFALVGIMTNLKAPNLIKLKVQMVLLTKGLTEVFTQLSKFAELSKEKKYDEKIAQLGLVIFGDGNEGKNAGLFKIMQKLQELLPKLTETVVGTLILGKLFKFGSKNNTGPFDVINTIVENIVVIGNNAGALGDRDFSKTLSKSKSTIELFGSIVSLLMKLGLNGMALMVLPVVTTIKCVFQVISVITEKLSTIETDKISSANDNLDVIQSFLENIRKITTNILITAVLAVPAIVGMLVILTFIPILAGFIIAINWLSKVIAKISDSASKKILDINKVFVSLIIVGAAIVFFALITPVLAWILTGNLLPFIGVLALSIVILWVVMALTAKFAQKASIESLIVSMSIVLIMASLLIAMAAILFASYVGKTLQEGEAWLNILLAIGGILLISAAAIGLGIALSVAAPFMGMAIVGITPLIAMLGVIVGAGIAILALANFDLNKETIKKAKGNIDKIKEVTDYIKTNIVSTRSDRKEMRRTKRFMRQVNKTVNTIVKIADKLDKLSKIDIKQEKIIGKGGTIETVFSVIGDIETKLHTFNETTGQGATYRRAQINARKRMRRNKRVLNKVDKVINKIADITESLNSIKEFKLTDKEQTELLSSIGHIFECVNTVDNEIRKFNGLTVISGDNDTIGETSGLLDRLREIRAARKQRREYKHNAKTMSKVEACVLSVGGIVDALNSIKDFKVTQSDIETKLADIFGCVNTVATKINTSSINNLDDSVLNKFTPIVKTINEMIDPLKTIGETKPEIVSKNIDTYSNFIDKVNTVDVERLQTSSQMFEQMSKFSSSIKGDFDKLAESLSGKLLPVLTELKEVMSVLPEKIDVGFQNTSASIAATSAPATKENITAQITRENPNLSKNDVETIVNSRLAEKARSDANSVIAKLDEMMSLLKGFSGENIIVKTV
jgi:hypothetical protein